MTKVEDLGFLSLSDSSSDIKPFATEPSKPEVIDLCSPNMKPAVTHSSVTEAPGVVRVGSTYPLLEAAQDAIYAQENCLGHVWHRGQETKSSDGSQKKMTFRCNHYHHPTPSHSHSIDISDHHRGKSIKTNCMAHINVNRIQHSNIMACYTC
jgi:hypothetical protein